MKKLAILTIGFALLVSCSESLEQKAERFAERQVKKTLLLPDSYDPVETVVDSAFSPEMDPRTVSSFLTLYDIGMEVQKQEDAYNRAKDTKERFHRLKNSYGKSYYDKADREMKEAENVLSLLSTKADDVSKVIEEVAADGRRHIGFLIKHTYRYKENNGDVHMKTDRFLVDPEIQATILFIDEGMAEKYDEILSMGKAFLEQQKQAE